MGSKSAHAAAAKGVGAGVYAMRMRPGVVLHTAERLHINAVGILPRMGVVVARPVFAKIVDACGGISARRCSLGIK